MGAQLWFKIAPCSKTPAPTTDWREFVIPKLLQRNFARRDVKKEVRGWVERSDEEATERPRIEVVVQRAIRISSSFVAPTQSLSRTPRGGAEGGLVLLSLHSLK